MRQVNVGVVGLGNVGSGTLAILADNAGQIAQKCGFQVVVKAVCSRTVETKKLAGLPAGVLKTTNWRDVVAHPEVDIVAELVGGTHVAREIVEDSIAHGKSVVTANKELMAECGADLWDCAIKAGVNLGIEASVAGGIPILATLREGIAGDRVTALYGILNGTCNYILTEIEQHGTAFGTVLRDAQKLGYAEADPAADIDGFDARSKLAILAALSFGERITPSDIHTEGIRRVLPVDFQYAHQLDYTIRLIGSARQTAEGLILSVRPSLIPNRAILAGVRGSYNAIWIRGHYGQDTFYYGRGAGALPTGVAVVSDIMRVGREIRSGSPQRVSPFAHERLGEYQPISVDRFSSSWFLRFRVEDRPGIIARLATVLSGKGISLDAVLQIPTENWRDLPFVITTQPCREESLKAALADMAEQVFLIEPPFAMPMEDSLG